MIYNGFAKINNNIKKKGPICFIAKYPLKLKLTFAFKVKSTSFLINFESVLCCIDVVFENATVTAFAL